MTSPNFLDISQIPRWIHRVKDFYYNNPIVTPRDILVLKFLSAGLDFHQEERYDAFNFITVEKIENLTIKVPTTRKEF